VILASKLRIEVGELLGQAAKAPPMDLVALVMMAYSRKKWIERVLLVKSRSWSLISIRAMISVRIPAFTLQTMPWLE
jgi:hypothetical protein